MKKNVAGQIVGVQMVNASTGAAFTSPVTVYITKDDGTQTVGSIGSPAGECNHKGRGYHTYAPTQAETNADHIAFTFTGSGAVPVTVQVDTTFPQTGDSYARLGAPVGASISADVAGVQSDTNDIQTRLPAALVSGRIDASVGAMAADTLTASALATDAVAEIQSGLATTSALAVVAGYVDTEVAAIKAKTDNLPSDPADASDIATSFSTVNATLATIDGRIDTEVVQIKQVTDKLHSMLEAATGSPGESRFTADALRNAPAGSGGAGGAPSAAEVAAAVWDEAIGDHLDSGSTGAALNAAGSAGDPWSTTLPGAYGAGTAGYIIGATMKASADRFLTMVEVASGSPGDYKFTPDALRAVIGIVPTAVETADALLKRDWTLVTGEASRSMLNAGRFIRNGFSIAGSTLTVLKEDDTSAAYTRDLTTDAAADPITGVS